MKFKGTTALLAIFVVLGAYVYFAEYRGKETRQKQEEAKKKAINVDSNDITEISLVFPDHTIKRTQQRRKAGGRSPTRPALMMPVNMTNGTLPATYVPRIEQRRHGDRSSNRSGSIRA